MTNTRRGFIGDSLATLAASTIAEPLLHASGNDAPEAVPDFYLRLVRANDQAVSALLQASPRPAASAVRIGRGQDLQALACAFCAPESAHYRSAALIPLMERAAALFPAAQHADGAIDAGNLDSPPDTAFVVSSLAQVLHILQAHPDASLDSTRTFLRKFLMAAGEALVTGGIHTPNHRWVVCAALARLHSLSPDPRYVSRIDDWLGEGIFIDSDGQFEERSTAIYSRVIDESLLAMARLLNRPALFDFVRRNLEMNLFYAHPDGELETVASRRQDVAMTWKLGNYYVLYRYLAIRDVNPRFAAAVRFIEADNDARLVEGANPLIHFLDEPLLRQAPPEGGEMPSNYAKVFANSGIARIRRTGVSATVFGGSDWPAGVASGLSSSPTFFRFRAGKAILDSVRMGAEFFSEGVFRSAGLSVEGNQYSLHQRFDVPYYQPLPARYRNGKGDYALTPARDFRFWSKLDFPHRPMSNIQTLDQKITIAETTGAFELRFDISGHDRVSFTIELAFRPGGEFEGSFDEFTSADGQKLLFLKAGLARYKIGGDAIEFGPGEAQHRFVELGGPSYQAHGASLRAPGNRVYLTVFTPVQRTVFVRAA